MASPFHISRVHAGIVVVAALVFAGAGVLAYQSGYLPSVMGHLSEEIQFHTLNTDYSQYYRFCDPDVSTICALSCPADAGDTHYTLIGGQCTTFSSDPLRQSRWKSVGRIGATPNTWECEDSAHVSGDTLRTMVICLQGSA